MKYTKIDYYVVGEPDSYVKLYDMKFSSEFALEAPYISLYDKNVQQVSGAGSFCYQDGVLNLTSVSDNGYTVKLDVNKTFNPTDMVYLAADMSATVPYNISLEVTRADGDATIEMRKEFFDMFGYAEAPEALPAKSFTGSFNMNGYYYWNGGLVNESTIKSVTISLTGKGDFSMCALQVSKKSKPVYINDGETNSGELKENAPSSLTSSIYTVGDAIVSKVAAETTVADFLNGFDQSDLIVKDNNGNVVDSTAFVGGGMIVTSANGDFSYTIAVKGDVSGDGEVTSIDARMITQMSVGITAFSDWQELAADFDDNNDMTTADVRAMLVALIK